MRKTIMKDTHSRGTQVSKEFAECSILAEDNSQIQIQSFWKEKTAVLVFVRHFG